MQCRENNNNVNDNNLKQVMSKKKKNSGFKKTYMTFPDENIHG